MGGRHKAKRGLSLLLAILTVLTLCVPAFAEEEVTATPAAEPKATEAPESAEGPEAIMPVSINSISVDLYALESPYADVVTIPDSYPQQYQIPNVSGGTSWSVDGDMLKSGAIYQFAVRCCAAGRP